jgi:hypothetical protein
MFYFISYVTVLDILKLTTLVIRHPLVNATSDVRADVNGKAVCVDCKRDLLSRWYANRVIVNKRAVPKGRTM